MLVVQLAVLLSFLSSTRWIQVGADCEKRTVHNDVEGTITHGEGSYKELALCEWLITGELASSLHHGGTMRRG